MAISTLYIPAFSLNTVFLDKDTGSPLSGGIVTFYEDEQRQTLKPVYQITGTSPSYTFTQLSNPMTLSSTGTFVDSLGNPVVPYFYPYSSSGAIELYYVTIYSSDAVLQATREAVPYVIDAGSGLLSSNVNNQISNPQFVEVLFPDNGPVTYSVTGTDTVTPVAPNWDMITTGTGTVTVERLNSISISVDSSPPYALQFASTGITGTVQVRQRLSQSPRLFANEYVSAYAAVSVSSAGSIDFTLDYVPSSGTSHELINASVASGVGFIPLASSTLINGTINTNNADVGYVDIIASFPVSSTVSITSIQLAGTGSEEAVIEFSQESTPRQIDNLFHYYKPELEYKPIPSYLVGWDFALNPTQFLGPTIASAAFNIGANKSQYIWDQTIAFQTVDQGIGVARTAGQALQLTAASTCQMALIQYLPQQIARELLLGYMAVKVTGFASAATDFTVSLWYTDTAGNLPSVAAGTNNSIVATLSSSGAVATTNAPSSGSWTEVARSNMGNAKGTLTTTLASHDFNGWATTAGAGSNSAKFFAIVVGTASVTSTNTVTFQSISLCRGDIATVPAAKTFNETLLDCQYYYQKSFAPGTVPANNAGSANASMATQVAAGVAVQPGPIVRYPTPMRAVPTVTLYNPSSGASGQIYNPDVPGSWTLSAASSNAGVNGFISTGTSVLGSLAAQKAYVHWSADARLGIVN